MARIRSAKTAAVLLAATGLGFGLIGSGVHATMTDGGSVSESVSVGSLHCAVSSTDPGAVVAGNSVTLQLPSIQSSAAGSAGYANVTVSNTGTMPEVVHWTTALSGLSSRFTAAPGTPSIASDVTLAVGANQPYSGFGFVWSTLSNPDLGTSGQSPTRPTAAKCHPLHRHTAAPSRSPWEMPIRLAPPLALETHSRFTVTSTTGRPQVECGRRCP